MEINPEDRTEIETRLNNTNDQSLEQLKNVIRKYGIDFNTGCFCKESNKLAFLQKVKDWYSQQTND